MGLSLHSDIAYAYTLKNLDQYIDNPEFFDYQEGKASINVGIDPIVGTPDAIVNVARIYFDSKHKTFQILARQYDPKKGINLTSKDMKWSVIDERICTVDKNGKVTAGEMTGVTVVIMEEKGGYLVIPVLNITGNCDKWYEEMYKDIDINPVYTYFSETEFLTKDEARKACDYIGNTYKTITDAYLTYGDSLKTDPKIRLNVINDAADIAFELVWLVDNTGKNYWFKGISAGDIMKCRVFELFISKESKCGLHRDTENMVFMIDGVIYIITGANVFEEIGKESDCIRRDGKLYGSFQFEVPHFDFKYGIWSTDYVIVDVEISFEKKGISSFTEESEYMMNFLKNGDK